MHLRFVWLGGYVFDYLGFVGLFCEQKGFISSE